MPKRKRHEDESDSINYIKKKIKKLERKLLKGKRRRLSSSSESVKMSDEPQGDTIFEPEDYENLYDDVANPRPSTSASCHDLSQQIFDTPEVPRPQSINEPEQTIEKEVQQITELDKEALEILGADPSTTVTYGKDIQKDLAIRFEHIATSGLTRELRKELLESHMPPTNCKMIDSPSLNPEIKVAISDVMVKRDKAMQAKQKQIGSAIACLGKAITLLLSQEIKHPTLLKLLMDTGRILCDSQFNESIVRRNFIMAVLKKELKDQIQLTKIDNLLFGQELADTLKTAKAINKSGAELKVTAPPRSFPSTSKPKPAPPSRNLNWKAPAPNRRSTGPLRAREPAAPVRQQPVPSSRPSRGRPSSSRGRH